MSVFTLSRYALEEMERRGITPAAVHAVLNEPEQILPGYGGLRVYQSLMELEGKSYLLRVVVNGDVDPIMVVTVYRTSRIAKYWRSE